jgi:tripartite-type tricarboxylate transporter receptor subunit TctC
MTTRRKFLLGSVAVLAIPVLPRIASVQTWPTKAIRAIVPFTPGKNTTDKE